jgi:nucleolar protein 6
MAKNSVEVEDDFEGVEAQKSTTTDERKKYILFVGNLSFKSTANEIKEFFESKGAAVTAVRLLTDKKTKRPKGFAFCEFESPVALEAALALHLTKFAGRKINVELTAGGGGSKSKVRKEKIKAKNEKYRLEHAVPIPAANEANKK